METMRVADIRKHLQGLPEQDIEKSIGLYKLDQRVQVQKLVQVYEKKVQKWQKELERLKKMEEYENLCRAEGFSFIGGMDEVGRGPLAGPVVSALVVLPVSANILGINDSKKLSPAKREMLFEEIKKKALFIAVAEESPQTIDEINILQATFSTMRQCVAKADHLDYVLVDGVKVPGLDLPQKGIVKGDEKSVSIAAASIVAKVTRDRMMTAYDMEYPGYGFAANKGYGTREHIEAIKELGLCPIHRRSFVSRIVEKNMGA